MVTKDEVLELLRSTETYRIERTISTGDMDKFQEAICAFSNDLSAFILVFSQTILLIAQLAVAV